VLIWVDSVSVTVALWILVLLLGFCVVVLYKTYWLLHKLAESIEPALDAAPREIAVSIEGLGTRLAGLMAAQPRTTQPVAEKALGSAGQRLSLAFGPGERIPPGSLRVSDLLGSDRVFERVEALGEHLLLTAPHGEWAITNDGVLVPRVETAVTPDEIKNLRSYFDLPRDAVPGHLVITKCVRLERNETGNGRTYKVIERGQMETIPHLYSI